MDKNTVLELIDLIKIIDSNLDAYEYSGYTYEEYLECIKKNIHGHKSLRNLYLSNRHVWNDYCEKSINEIKEIVNLLYKKYVLNKTTYIDKDRIEKCIIKLNDTNTVFKAHTDNCVIYPIQSSNITQSINKIIMILHKYE